MWNLTVDSEGRELRSRSLRLERKIGQTGIYMYLNNVVKNTFCCFIECTPPGSGVVEPTVVINGLGKRYRLEQALFGSEHRDFWCVGCVSPTSMHHALTILAFSYTLLYVGAIEPTPGVMNIKQLVDEKNRMFAWTTRIALCPLFSSVLCPSERSLMDLGQGREHQRLNNSVLREGQRIE